MLRLIINIIALIFLSSSAFTQQEHEFICPSDNLHSNKLQTDFKYQAYQKEFTKNYLGLLDGSLKPNRSSQTVYKIPVVIHVIHAGDPLGSIANQTDQDIKDVFNEGALRFRHTHGSGVTYPYSFWGVDTEIDLCLATVDPDGNYTNGITRHYEPLYAEGPYSDPNITGFLQSISWDQSKYCNLFIMKDLSNAAGVYLGGLDGVIFDSGVYWSGLMAHELGHYFNLRHIFYPDGVANCDNNDCTLDGDQVCDTPVKSTSGSNGANDCDAPNNGCTTDEDDSSANNPFRSIAAGGLGEQDDMLRNYMDYTGGCWDAFTQGQKTRMEADILTHRLSQDAHAAIACDPMSVANRDLAITNIDLAQVDQCQNTITPEITLENKGLNNITSTDITLFINDIPVYTEQIMTSLASGISTTLTLSQSFIIPLGNHLISIQCNNANGMGTDDNVYNDINFNNASYIGGSTCLSYSDCNNFNSNSSSGPGNTTIVDVTEMFPASPVGVTDIYLCVSLSGDSNSSAEQFNILDENGNSLGITVPNDDCQPHNNEACFFMPVSDYDTFRSDGVISFTLDPLSFSINPNLCFTNEACVSLYIPQGINCPTSLNIDNVTVIDNTYQANDQLSSSNSIVPTNGQVLYHAGTTICLDSGFEVDGSVASFEASILNCN